jgi:hypothetical protein
VAKPLSDCTLKRFKVCRRCRRRRSRRRRRRPYLLSSRVGTLVLILCVE